MAPSAGQLRAPLVLRLEHRGQDTESFGVLSARHERRSGKLLSVRDGPMLEAVKQWQGGTLRLPGRFRDRPHRDRLAMHFARFQEAI